MIKRFDNSAALAEAVAALVGGTVEAAIEQRGFAHLVFSGGSTPEIFLPLVAKLDLPWSVVNVMLADERWVDVDSPHSNSAMLQRTLLSHVAANFISLKNNAASANDGVAVARKILPPLEQRYDLVLLGMGNDGHFASLFPHSPRLAELLSLDNTERLAAVPAPTTATPTVERITLTLAELKRSERMVLVLQGEAKLDVLHRAWQIADAMLMPVLALGEVETWCCP